jgi:hypothetical protein
MRQKAYFDVTQPLLAGHGIERPPFCMTSYRVDDVPLSPKWNADTTDILQPIQTRAWKGKATSSVGRWV